MPTNPDREPREGSTAPHPPPRDSPAKGDPAKRPFPDTGWCGEPRVPSSQGGSGEKDFMHKPPYEWVSEGDKFQVHYESECWCGNVAFEFHGNPLDAKHCHCKQCQRLHGTPFQWAVIFPKTSVRLKRNKTDSLHFFSTELRTSSHHVPCKVSCDVCRSPLFDEGRNTVLAYPSAFRFAHPSASEGGPRVPKDFMPSCHIFYSERVMEVPDGVPKWEGHKGTSRLMQELTNAEGMLPKYKMPKEEGDKEKALYGGKRGETGAA